MSDISESGGVGGGILVSSLDWRIPRQWSAVPPATWANVLLQLRAKSTQTLHHIILHSRIYYIIRFFFSCEHAADTNGAHHAADGGRVLKIGGQVTGQEGAVDVNSEGLRFR